MTHIYIAYLIVAYLNLTPSRITLYFGSTCYDN